MRAGGRDALQKIRHGREARVAGSLVVKRPTTHKLQLGSVVGVAVHLAVVELDRSDGLVGGKALETGHEHHLRAINRIRAYGGIKQAVEAGVLTSGVMFNCIKYDIDVVLAGSIRDDGPLPDVITDVVQAQQQMRRHVRKGVQVALMLSTMLHSIAVGNLLPATVYTVCVDINPSTLTKLVDRGSFQTLGIVMDVSGFLRDLLAELDRLENAEPIANRLDTT